jgi:hypothetical protein
MEDVYSLFVKASQMEPGVRTVWIESLDLTSVSRSELDVLVGELDSYQPGHTKVRTLIVGTVRDACPEPADNIGRVIGPYWLERLVVDAEGRSAGNMGHVYQARRIDGAFDQTVAIKIIQYLRDDPGGRERFIRERRYLGNLRHPNIVRILDAGSVGFDPQDDPQPYFTMEWVEDGLDLLSYVRVCSLSLPDRLKLFVQICEGVAYAHSQGVVHRDLKPQNLLVDRHGTPRLLDFGISSGDGDESDNLLLRSAMTLAYASPEQLAKEPVGPASDIYSLGVILYEMLAGRRPYEMSGEWERDREFLRDVVISKVPGVGYDLDCIVQKALQKDLGARYRHVDQMLRDLRRYLNRDPVEASLQRLGRYWGSSYWVLRYARKYLRFLVGAVLLGAIVLLLSAELGRRGYVQLQERFKGGRLAAEAVLAQQRGDQSLGATLAIEAAGRDETFAARSVLQGALPNLPRRIVSEVLPDIIQFASLSPDRSAFILMLQNGSLQVRSAATARVISTISLPVRIRWNGASPCAAFSADGNSLAIVVPRVGVVFSSLKSAKVSYFQRFAEASNAVPDLDCSGEPAGNGLSYKSPTDWNLLVRASGGQYLYISARDGASTVNGTFGCDLDHFRCLFRRSRGLELRRIDSATGGGVQEFPDARDGALSSNGRRIAVRRGSGEIEVAMLTADGRPDSGWQHYGSAFDGHLLLQYSGARLLVDDGDHWRVYVNFDRSSGVYARDQKQVAALDPVSFFLFEQITESLLDVRTAPGTNPFRIPTEGHVTARVADDVTGSLVIADRGGHRLSVWRLPVWPGGFAGSDSVLSVSDGRAWAAGWTRTGDLVLYSPIDGSIETVLDEKAATDRDASGISLHLWSLRNGKWLLGQRGAEISLWDLAGKRLLGRIVSGQNPVLAVDAGSRWLAVTTTEPSLHVLVYELPGFRLLDRIPAMGILGIASGRNPDEIAVLFAGSNMTRPSYQAALYGTQPFARRREFAVSDPNGTRWDWSDIHPPIGSPCASASSRPLSFGFEQVKAHSERTGHNTGCYSIHVNIENHELTFATEPRSILADRGWTAEISPSARSDMSRLYIRRKDGEMLASELVESTGPPPMMVVPGGFAFRQGKVWHQVFFSFAELRREACNHLLSPVPPDLGKQYAIAADLPSCSTSTRGQP